MDTCKTVKLPSLQQLAIHACKDNKIRIPAVNIYDKKCIGLGALPSLYESARDVYMSSVNRDHKNGIMIPGNYKQKLNEPN